MDSTEPMEFLFLVTSPLQVQDLIVAESAQAAVELYIERRILRDGSEVKVFAIVQNGSPRVFKIDPAETPKSQTERLRRIL